MEKTGYARAEEAFFKLLRLSIGTGHGLDVVLDGDGWAEVYAIARKQAVAAIVLDGVERLPDGRKPPKETLMPWIGLVQQIENRNRMLNRLAVGACKRLERDRMATVLLKGQGNALLYPRPLHRMPGDIDLWVDCGRKALVDYARKYCPGTEVTYHHVDFPVAREAELELHFTPSWMNQWRMNRRLQRCFKTWKDGALHHKVALPEGAGEVAVPTLGMNRVYLLVHIYRHLFDEGIGLRQLLDYCLVLRQPCPEVVRVETARVLARLHLKRFAGAVMYVLQIVFGLEDCHLLLPPDPERGRRLLAEVMKAGNFGQYDERIRHTADETSFGRFWRKVSRNAGFLSDYPGESLWTPLFKMWHYAWRAAHGYFPREERKPSC